MLQRHKWRATTLLLYLSPIPAPPQILGVSKTISTTEFLLSLFPLSFIVPIFKASCSSHSRCFSHSGRYGLRLTGAYLSSCFIFQTALVLNTLCVTPTPYQDKEWEIPALGFNPKSSTCQSKALPHLHSLIKVLIL